MTITFKQSQVNSFYIIFILIGSEMLGVIGSIIKINIQPLLWGINVFLLTLAALVVFQSVINRHKVINIGWSFFIFFSLYFIRIFVDLYINNVYTSSFSNPKTYFIYLLGLCFMFSCAIIFLRDIDFEVLSKNFYLFLFVLLVLSIVFNSILKLDSASALRSHGAQNIGALTYGHLGVSFSLMSLHFFTTSEKWIRKAVFISGIGFGIFVVFLASSRSPVLALIICMITYLMVWNGMTKGLIYFLLLALPIYLFWDEIMVFMSGFHTNLFQRVRNAIVSGDTSGRGAIFEQALKQIKNAPILGESFLLREGEFKGYYPHNIILESLMATGIVGTLFLFNFFLKLFKASFKLIALKDRYAWVAILFFQYFLFGMISKSIYTNTMLWYYSALLLYLFAKRKKGSYVTAN